MKRSKDGEIHDNQMGRRKPDDRQENPGRSGFDREAQFSQADWRRCIYRCHGGRRCRHIVVGSVAVAQTAKEESEREAAAEHVMTIATAYILGASRSYPIMQLDLKENIQNATNGKVYVRLAPGGQLGAGGALVQKVQGGTIQAAQHSLSNFAPFAPAADLINLPYFCGANQKFVNLVTSDTWKSEVHPKIEAAGFKPLFYVVIDPRVVAVRKGGDVVMSPADMAGVKFRVPGSAMLQQYYRMVGANPTPVAWGETPSAIKQGVADALDPSVGALYVFGFKDILSHVTFTQAVPDSQVFSMNLEWFNGLPADVQEGIEFAGEITAQQNLAKVPAARNYAMSELRKSGVEFHSLTMISSRNGKTYWRLPEVRLGLLQGGTCRFDGCLQQA
jgi:TRAP-type C4-dicarboxylate transport system substrate-binding protein